jgi:hypothetical protein
MRDHHAQTVARSEPHHQHVVAHTHCLTFSARLDLIDIIY